MGDRLDDADPPGSPAPGAAIGEVLPPKAPTAVEAAPATAARAESALAVVRRLARTQHLPAELIAVLDGKLADAVVVAADYASDAITERTRAAYLGDWSEFATWCRAQRVDPTVLPIHPVLV